MSLGPAVFLARRILGLREGGPRLPRGQAKEKGQGGGRYLRGAVFGVALSIVPLVVVLVVSDGMIEGITARYIETGTYHLQAQPIVVVEPPELEARAAELRALPGVKGVFPEYQGYGVAIAGTRTAGVALRAVESSFLDDPGTAAYLELKSGERKLESSSQILLGEALARSLGAAVGDTVTIVTERPGSGGSDAFVPKLSYFRVRGIVSAGYRELDSLWAFVSLRAGSRAFSVGGARALLGIKVQAPFGELESARGSASAALGPDWNLVTWPEAERNIYKSFSTTRALLLLVMALAVAVAAINVSSALVMLVLERRRDIAILKSAGASPSFIARTFVLAGLAIGGFGSLCGIGVGALISWRINDLIAVIQALVNGCSRLWGAISGSGASTAEIRLLDPSYYLEHIPVNIKLGELAVVACASVSLCFVASLLPARRASKLPPMDIFRKT